MSFGSSSAILGIRVLHDHYFERVKTDHLKWIKPVGDKNPRSILQSQIISFSCKDTKFPVELNSIGALDVLYVIQRSALKMTLNNDK